jgi:hypothetical protein
MQHDITLAQQMTEATKVHEDASALIPQPEIRIYSTKTTRKLASGELKDYIIKHHYVVKKAPGISKTELKKREAKKRATIGAKLSGMTISQLHEVEKLCEKLNSSIPPECRHLARANEVVFPAELVEP